MPMPELLKSKKHALIQNRINNHSKLGNVQREYVELFNNLSSLRPAARYLNEAFNPSYQECEQMLSIAQKLFEFVDESSPKRTMTNI